MLVSPITHLATYTISFRLFFVTACLKGPDDVTVRWIRTRASLRVVSALQQESEYKMSQREPSVPSAPSVFIRAADEDAAKLWTESRVQSAAGGAVMWFSSYSIRFPTYENPRWICDGGQTPEDCSDGLVCQ